MLKFENPLDHEHKQWQVDVAIGDDIGFKLNKDGVYEHGSRYTNLERSYSTRKIS